MPKLLLVIDAFSPVHRLLPAAVFLASRRNAELVCVFTQDSRVLPGVALSCTREIGAHSALCYPVTSGSIKKRMTAIAEDVRRSLSQEAERQHIRWEFQQCFGSISQILIETEAEIVVPGWPESHWTDSMHPRVQTHKSSERLVIAVVDEDLPSSGQIIEIVRSLMGTNGAKQLIILSLKSRSGGSSKPVHQPAGQSSGVTRIRVDSIEELIQHLRRLRPTLALLGREQPVFNDIRLHKTLATIKCPLALLHTIANISTPNKRVVLPE